MNSFERTMRRLQGQAVDRTPNFDLIMAFSMRFIGKPLAGYYLDYRTLCEAQLAVLEAFDLDSVSIIADSHREAADLGAHVEFPDDDLPFCKTPLFANLADRQTFRLPNPILGARMGDAVEGIRSFHEQVGGEVPVQGWVEGALAQANILCGDALLMLALYDKPEWVADILALCTEVEIAFAREQIRAGADIIGVGDAIASLLSVKMYQQFALPYEQQIFRAIHEMGALGRLHICGKTTRLLPLMAQSGADIVDLDWMVDIRQATTVFGDGPALCGNFDPVAVMLQGTPEQVRGATLLCQEEGGSRYFSGAGCEIPEGTPHANLRAQAAALKLARAH